MIKLIFPFFLLITTFQTVFSQTLDNAPNGNNLLKMSQSKIIFQKPDSSFVALIDESGYENLTMNAKVVGVIVPAPFAGVRNSIQKGKKTNILSGITTLFVDSFTVKSNGKEMFMLVSKIISPDTTQYEHYLMLQGFLKVPSADYCISMNAAYPNSKDSASLRWKFTNAFLTAKEEE